MKNKLIKIFSKSLLLESSLQESSVTLNDKVLLGEKKLKELEHKNNLMIVNKRAYDLMDNGKSYIYNIYFSEGSDKMATAMLITEASQDIDNRIIQLQTLKKQVDEVTITPRN